MNFFRVTFILDALEIVELNASAEKMLSRVDGWTKVINAINSVERIEIHGDIPQQLLAQMTDAQSRPNNSTFILLLFRSGIRMGMVAVCRIHWAGVNALVEQQ